MTGSNSLDARPLVEALRDRAVVVLAGAGCSTESGIPDYRGPDGRMRGRRPMQFGEFVRSEEARRRYWARSAIGWRRVSGARPNAAHAALVRLEEAGIVRGIITQNVDGLHQAAGTRRVVELHGTLARVRCLSCGSTVRRSEYQARIEAMNPRWLDGAPRLEDRTARPDGDAAVPDDDLASFRVPACGVCGGVLKPDVVFFGETVPRVVVERAWDLFGEADALLVVGSSLTVYSGRRFVHRATERGIPIAVVNEGPTRADEVAAVKVEGRLGTVLPRVAEELAQLPR